MIQYTTKQKLIVVGICVAFVILAHALNQNASKSRNTNTVAAAKVDAEEEEAFQRSRYLMKRVREAAHDPESITVTKCFYTQTGTVVVEFRAKNGFNAMRNQVAIWSGDNKILVVGPKDSVEVVKAWNKVVAKIPYKDLPLSYL